MWGAMGARLVFVALAAAACAGTVAAATGPKPARLRVEQVLLPHTPLPVEGAYSYVRVERLSGRPVVQRRLSFGPRPATTLLLAAGRYRLRSWQRACDGNCGHLDPPSDRCARRFEVKPGQRVNATIRLRYGSACRIVFTAQR